MLWAAFLGSPVPHGRIRSIDTSPGSGDARRPGGPDRRGRRARPLRPAAPGPAGARAGTSSGSSAIASRPSRRTPSSRPRRPSRRSSVDIEELTPARRRGGPARTMPRSSTRTADAYVYLAGTRPAGARIPTSRAASSDVAARTTSRRSSPAPPTSSSTRSRRPAQHHGYIEPHATMVWVEATGRSTSSPPTRRRSACAARWRPRSACRPRRSRSTPAPSAATSAARATRSTSTPATSWPGPPAGPVKAVTRYADELAALNVRHAARIRLRTAVDGEGRLLAHEADLLFDGGAYASAKPLPAPRPRPAASRRSRPTGSRTSGSTPGRSTRTPSRAATCARRARSRPSSPANRTST